MSLDANAINTTRAIVPYMPQRWAFIKSEAEKGMVRLMKAALTAVSPSYLVDYINHNPRSGSSKWQSDARF